MTSRLIKSAEIRADEARMLPNFNKVSLPGLKEQVAQVLNMIGRVEGLFSTYTMHDITHINSMLGMLEWLIPPSTAKIMTPIDWLMLVLSIYLHDLGLVVTAEEYHLRYANEDFVLWRDSLDKDIEGREYIARTLRMSDIEKDHFFFQEFIRKGHASRISEWITGRHSRTWGSGVAAIAARIGEVLSGIPPRFRDHLAQICESHHNDDLNRIEKYPLCARYGNDSKEIANVQYLAVILRSADLLHVTKDRTPSIMYQSLCLSDPKSVSEWDKQIGTFAVGPIGRNLIENDPDSAIIVVSADFLEERPLFALQEYITYADKQIQQSKRWIDKSQESKDAAEFSFPWNAVKGDVRLEGVPPYPLKFEFDRGRLLDLLVGHTIYNEPTVAVREILQNAIDAVRYDHYLSCREARAKGQSEPPIGSVIASWDPDTRILIIEDNGIGMDKDTIKFHLMRVGASFYRTPQFENDYKDFTPISRFGIGILTCFMISDDIEIITCRQNIGFRIKMTSVHSDYLLRELMPGDPLLNGLGSHGTRVKLRIRNSVSLPFDGMGKIIRHWIVLPECKVVYREKGKEEIIGFQSSEAALTDLLKNSKDSEGEQVKIDEIEYITKRRKINDKNSFNIDYQMSFVVDRSGYWPERGFHKGRIPKAIVCIEGIRVADNLPGFDSINGILSIRGNRLLRTTVSRAGLERDDEYDRTTQICADMLFEHINDEVNRISAKSGHPLSQASTAAKWLYESLNSSYAPKNITEYLWDKYEKLPAIVIEYSESKETSQIVTNRTLISHHQLSLEPEFWTAESRLLDSLGIISRDLGRELSLNEFLSTLAPEFRALRFSPLVTDAQQFRDLIITTHKPISSEFSRLHQQSATRWVPRESTTDNSYIDFLSLYGEGMLTDILKSTERNVLDDSPYYYLRKGRNKDIEEFKFIEIAPLEGDDSEVDILQTRTVCILKTGSSAARLWLQMQSIFVKLAEFPQYPEIIGSMLTLSNYYVKLIAYERRNGRYHGIREDYPWRDQAAKVQQALKKINVDFELPDDIRHIVQKKNIFDASAYWRDWLDRED